MRTQYSTTLILTETQHINMRTRTGATVLFAFSLFAPQLELFAAGAALGSPKGATRTISASGFATDELLSLEDLESLDASDAPSVFAVPEKLRSGPPPKRRSRWGKGRRDRESAASPEAEFKSNTDWWKDPLSHFDDKGNEIAGSSNASKGRGSNPFALVVPALGKVASTIAQHPFLFISTSAVMILLTQLDENTQHQAMSGMRRLKDKVVSLVPSRRDSQSTSSIADDDISQPVESSPIASTKASRNASRSGIFGSKKQKLNSDTIEAEAEMRGLLARAISAEKEKQNAEQKHDMLQSQMQTMKRQLEKVMSSNADLHAHLQATQKISADVQLLSDKIDKLAIYIGRQLQANGDSNGSAQRSISRYGRRAH